MEVIDISIALTRYHAYLCNEFGKSITIATPADSSSCRVKYPKIICWWVQKLQPLSWHNDAYDTTEQTLFLSATLPGSTFRTHYLLVSFPTSNCHKFCKHQWTPFLQGTWFAAHHLDEILFPTSMLMYVLWSMCYIQATMRNTKHLCFKSIM